MSACFRNVFAVCCDCCSVALSPVKDVLQESGEGCDGRHVQASPSDACRLESFSMFLQCMSFFLWRSDSSYNCTAGVTMPGWHLCSLPCKWSHVAQVVEHSQDKKRHTNGTPINFAGSTAG